MSSRLFWAAIAAALLPVSPAGADDAQVETLLKRLEEQESRIKVLERKLEIHDETARAAVSSTSVVKASERGFSLQSPDGANQVKLRGVLHVDGRYVADGSPELIDTWQATRIRPIIEGTLGGLYDFRFTPDFGQGRTVIQDAYVTARFRPDAQLTVGKFKSPVGLERLQSSNDIRFVARAYPTSLAPNRDLGLMLGGDLLDRRLSYAVAWLNGSNDGSSSETFGDVDANDDKDWAARLFAHPFAESDNFALRGLGVGIAGTYVDQDGSATQTLLPAFRTPAQSFFFRYRGGTTPTIAAGERTRIAPQLYYYAGAFGLIGEYTRVSQDVARTTDAGRRDGTVDTTAWQLAVSWFLTGEEASFRGFKPKSSFSLERGTWGALEITARYQQLDIDDDAFVAGAESFADPAASARRASSWGLGLNWYLNQNLKWVLNYEHTSFDGGGPDGTDRDDEQAFLTRIAVGF